MLKEARGVLEKLLRNAEVEKDRSRDITLPVSRIPDYPFSSAQTNQDFHSTLRLAEEAGAIQVEWRKHYEGHEIARLRLKNVRGLAAFLGVEYLSDAVNERFDSIEVAAYSDWVKACLEDIRTGWRQGRTVYGLKWEDANRLSDVLAAVQALEQAPLEQTLDYRQFGARVLGDSKRTRLIEKPLAALFRHHWEEREWTDRDVMQALNIVPMVHPVLLRGPLTLHHNGKRIDANISPYIGVHDSWLESMELSGPPSYVLTIENLSSFTEYTRVVVDCGLVLYTGGFPTRAIQRFYASLVRSTPAELWHWGDTDPHGFLILKNLQRLAVGREIRAHLMDQPLGAEYSKAALRDLERVKPVNPTIDALIDTLVSRRRGLVEQEEVLAQAVLSQ